MTRRGDRPRTAHLPTGRLLRLATHHLLRGSPSRADAYLRAIATRDDRTAPLRARELRLLALRHHFLDDEVSAIGVARDLARHAQRHALDNAYAEALALEGRSQLCRGLPHRALACFERALTARSPEVSPGTRLLALEGLLDAHRDQGNLDKAQQVWARARRLVARHALGAESAARLSLQRSLLLEYAGKLRGALRAINVASTAFTREDLPYDVARCALRRAEVLRLLGRTDDAALSARDAVEGFDTFGDRTATGWSLLQLGLALLEGGRDEGLAALRDALRLARIARSDSLRSAVAQELAVEHERRGDFDAAERHLDEALQATPAHGRAFARAQLDRLRAHIAILRHRRHEARALLRRVAPVLQRGGDPLEIAHLRLTQGVLGRREGRHALARRRLVEAASLYASQDVASGALHALDLALDLALDTRRAEDAQTLLAAATPLVHGSEDPASKALHAAQVARVEALDRAPREVRVARDEARRALLDAGDQWNAAKLDAGLSRTLSTRGQTEAAASLARTALADLSTLRRRASVPRLHLGLVEHFEGAVLSLVDDARLRRRWDEAFDVFERHRGLSGTLARSAARRRPAPTPSEGHGLRALSALASGGETTLAFQPPLEDGRLVAVIQSPGELPFVAVFDVTATEILDAVAPAQAMRHFSARVVGEVSARCSTLLLTRDWRDAVPLTGARGRGRFPNLAEVLSTATKLTILPHGVMGLVPWWGIRLPTGHSRVGERIAWVAAARLSPRLKSAPRITPRDRPKRVLILAATDASLPLVEEEVAEVEALCRTAGVQVNTLRGAEVSRETLDRRVGGVDLLYVAAHAEFLPSEPYGSSIHLGENASPLTLDDLLSLPPSGAEVVLSACRTAQMTIDRALDPLSLAAAFVLAGVRRVDASLWRLPDDVRWPREILRDRLSGARTVGPRNDSLRQDAMVDALHSWE